MPLQRTRARGRSPRLPVSEIPTQSEPEWVGQLMAPARTRIVVPATAAIDRTVTLSARWHDRRVLALLLRIAIFLVPLIASVLAALAVALAFPRPSGVLPVVGWWVALMVAGTVAMVLVDRVGRRFLPLAALLRMSLVFPDHAPSRFSVAARAGSVRTLERHLAAAKEAGVRDEPARVAEQIITLVGSLAMHDRRTRGHSERVRAFTDLLSEELKLSPLDRERLRWAALLHDVGKLDIAPALLNKPGAPTDAEWRELRAHPKRGAELVAPLLPWLGEWSGAIAQHHERWDGHGYPFGLQGEQIAVGARIVAVADAFEVMTAPRPYRRPVTAEAAREELASCAGQHFDPVVVRAFLNVSIGRLRKAMGPLSWAAQLPFIGMLPRAEALLGIFGRDAVATAATAAAGAGVVAVGTFAGPSGGVAAASDVHAPPLRSIEVGTYVDVDDAPGSLWVSRSTTGRQDLRRVDRTAASDGGLTSGRSLAVGTASGTTSSRTVAAAARPRAQVATPAPTAKGKPTAKSSTTTTGTGKPGTGTGDAPAAAAPRPAAGPVTRTTTTTRAPALPTTKRRADEVAAVQPAVPAVVSGVGRAVPAVVPQGDRSRP